MRKNKWLISLILFAIFISPMGQYASAAEDSETEAGSSLFTLNEQGYFAESFSKTIDLNGPVEYSPLANFIIALMKDGDAKATLANLQKAGEVYESASVTFYSDGRVWIAYDLTNTAYEAFKSGYPALKQSTSVVSNSYKVDVENRTVNIGQDDKFTLNTEDGSLSKTFLLVNELFSVDGEVVDPPLDETPSEEVNYTVMKNISFGTDEADERTKMDVYVPKNLDTSKKNGAFLIIYGGSWTSGSKEDVASTAETYASAGYVSVAINMRNASYNEATQKTEVTVYDMLDNVHDSVKKLKSLSDQHGWNIAGIATHGYSSGGNIALLYAYSRGAEMPYFNSEVILPVRFAVDVVGPVDMHDTAWNADVDWPDRNVMTGPGAGPAYAMLLTGAGNDPELSEEEKEIHINAMSPVHYVQTDGAVPTVMGYSKVDYIQNPNNGKILKGYLDNKNIRNDLFTFPKSIHGYYADPEEAEQFFDKSIEYAKTYFNGLIIDLAVTSKTASSVTFSWPAAVSGAEKLTIEQSPAGQNSWTTALTEAIAPDATSVTVTGLSAGTAYDFRLVVTGGVHSGNSNTISVSTEVNLPINTPAVPSQVPVTVKTDAVSTDFGIAKTSTRNSKTIEVMSVDLKKLNDYLSSKEEGSTVSLPMMTRSNTFSVELSGEMILAMESKKAVLEVQTENAAYKLPAKLIGISAVSSQLGDAVNMNSVKVQIEVSAAAADKTQQLEAAAQRDGFSLIASPVDFTVKVSYGEKSIEVTKFNEYVERTIILPDNINLNNIMTGVFVEADGTIRPVPTKVLNKNGNHYAHIKSMANGFYAVIWHPVEYSDTAHHWAGKAIDEMAARMVIPLTGWDLFSPNRIVTEAEFADILTRGLGIQSEEGSRSFTDATFRPNEAITRAEAMAMIGRAMEMTGLKPSFSADTKMETLHQYSDAGRVSDSAKDAVVFCLNNGIVNGRSPSLLAADTFITRAEVATIIQRVLEKSGLI